MLLLKVFSICIGVWACQHNKRLCHPFLHVRQSMLFLGGELLTDCNWRTPRLPVSRPQLSLQLCFHQLTLVLFLIKLHGTVKTASHLVCYALLVTPTLSHVNVLTVLFSWASSSVWSGVSVPKSQMKDANSCLSLQITKPGYWFPFTLYHCWCDPVRLLTGCACVRGKLEKHI